MIKVGESVHEQLGYAIGLLRHIMRDADNPAMLKVDMGLAAEYLEQYEEWSAKRRSNR